MLSWWISFKSQSIFTLWFKALKNIYIYLNSRQNIFDPALYLLMRLARDFRENVSRLITRKANIFGVSLKNLKRFAYADWINLYTFLFFCFVLTEKSISYILSQYLYKANFKTCVINWNIYLRV